MQGVLIPGIELGHAPGGGGGGQASLTSCHTPLEHENVKPQLEAG
jgi:hypothetical protein